MDTNDVPDEQATGTSGHGLATAAKIAAGVAAVLLGAGVTYALEHRSGSTASADAGAAAGSGFPAGAAGQPGGGPGGGPVAGEQHIQGAVAGKTAGSVTVRSSAGTATYTVNATTEILRDGRAATMSDVRVGDPVLVHVFPSASGKMMVERLLAGSSATDPGPGPGLGPPPDAGGTTA